MAVLVWLRAPPPPEAPDRLVLKRVGFTALSGWADDDHGAALAVFLRSCARLNRLPAARPVGPGGVAGEAADWRRPCDRAAATGPNDARAFFEGNFTPFTVSNNGETQGLFTGYYEIGVRGSRAPAGAYRVPLYKRPGDLVSVDLGLFRNDYKGRRIAGRVVGGRLLPYAGRGDIQGGALAGRGLELVWLDDPVDAFFLHVQGSGRVALADGGEMRVGYDGVNGHAYTSIGRYMAENGLITGEQLSMQGIRAWLAAHPELAGAVMARNGSYVFFRELEGDGPLGAGGAVLSPGRSLAVDRRYLPLGVPLWLETADIKRLMVAQDSGSAIQGPVRGDVYWGSGLGAGEIAGRMSEPGRYFLLLPNGVAAPL